MANEKRPNSNDERPGQGGDPGFNWRGIILFAIAFALIAGGLFFPRNEFANAREISFARFEELLEEDKIVKTPNREVQLVVPEASKTQELRGYMVVPNPKAATEEAQTLEQPFRTTVFLGYNSEKLSNLLDEHEITPIIKEESNMFASIFIGILPILLFLLILYFFFRQQIRMAGKGAMNFGKSKARLLNRERNKVTFQNVAGVDEAKEEVSEIVEFLKDPRKFQKLGGRIPKGVLMVGPPGTGKTLLARAIAGEADVPFFSISGSDFVEMFVGVGASRVRDMFEQGKKSAPCLIFIDEIDAVGRHRGHGLGGGHDEREQTLNALLVEMDGFDAQEGIIIIAATNRKDVLDPALLRPGRFDREVHVSLPDVKGREQILRVHAKKVKIADSVDLNIIARGTPGFSGAELANLINEAALMAASRGKKAVTHTELEEARDKVRWGRERRSMAMSEKEKAATAWHEAGHALASVLLPDAQPLHKVTIIPRGPYLGATMSLPEGDRYSFQKSEALDMLAMTMAGRIGEEVYTKDISNGAAGDISQATNLARRMVCEWGMSSLGMIQFGDHSDYVFLGREMGKSREYSEKTAQEIDSEVKRLIDEAYQRAYDLVYNNMEKLEAIAKALLEYETIDADQVKDLMEHGKMLNPPPPPPVSPSSDDKPKKETPEVTAGTPPPIPPGLTEQPA